MAEHPYDDWADIYDQVYSYLDYDLPFYLQQAQAADGPVLELGCGSGRVALTLAEAGIDVVGVDISPRMVEAARRKAKEAGLADHARFETGDMAKVKVKGSFGMVTFPFRSFQSMLDVDEQKAALANAGRHLAKGGLLVLDIFAPDIGQLASERDDAVPFHVRDVEQADGGLIVIWGQNGWEGVSQLNHARLIIEELDTSGVMTRRLYRDFDQRYTFRYEMQHLLSVCGFNVEAVYGDFDGGPVDDDSDDLVWVARKA